MELLKKIIRNTLWYLPPVFAHKILYYYYFRQKLDLKNPKTFNEKLQYLIIYEYNQTHTNLADKYFIRKFVKQKKYDVLLPKIYGFYQNSKEINFDKLPEKFVLKTNHGSGEVFVCTDKNKFNFESACNKLNKSLKKNFAKQSLEYHYSKIKPQIICEEYLDDGTGELPIDYKFYCFNGEVDCVLICSNRSKNLRLDYYDLKWNKKDYAIESYRSNKDFKKPKNLEKMIEISKEISKKFKFVRVDLYEINGKVYLGELTFTPAAGLIQYNTEEAQLRWGKMLNL